MSRFGRSLQHSLRQGRRLLALPARTGRLSAAFGAMLLLGSSLTVLATPPNTFPTITNATISPSTIDEGQTATLNVTFTDPDAADMHTVTILWDMTGEAKKEEFLLPAGQLTFQASHKFPDARRYENGHFYPVTVWLWVGDEQPGNDNYDGAGDVFKELKFTVKNVAPVINAHTIHVTKGPGKSGAVVLEGTYAEPGADTVQVAANWGDGAPGKPKAISACTVNQHARSFHCEHTYPTSPAKTYQVTLKAVDDDGGEHSVTHAVQIP